MPELPEVEHNRRLVEGIARGRRIERAFVERDEFVFGDVSPRRIRSALTGRTVESVARRGKYLWLVLDRAPHPVFHLGMTGAFRAQGDCPLVLASSPRQTDRQWPPRFTKLRLCLDHGEQLAFVNKRRLGRMVLRQHPLREPPVAKLGFDAWTEMPNLADFRRRLGRRRGVLKGLLLDQSFAAGVGNWIADEVLYQARLDPRRPVESLARAEVTELHRALRRVITTAVEADADKSRFPKGWLFHHRWGRKQGAKTARGETIQHITVVGRSTAWVPTRQR